MQTRLRETNPSKRLSGLTRVFESLSIRQSPLTYAIANIGFLVELQSCAALEQWRVEHGSKLRDELQMLSDFEVLLALGGYSYDHPRFCWPNVSADLPNPLTAKALGHPLFDDEKRKTNDFEIERGGQMNLITGSNMSGKSSFLRTVGLNAALAMAGAPVCADSFSLRPCRFSTSIQVTDDPSEGISRFYAEVKRIAQALREVEAAEEKKDLLPRLYLIDEMLSGTNSRERNIASEAILKRLCKAQRSFGLVTTHDLELAHLADEKSILCKHFSDRIEDGKLSFDYHLENGVSTTTNALYVLQLEGIRVGSDAESEA